VIGVVAAALIGCLATFVLWDRNTRSGSASFASLRHDCRAMWTAGIELEGIVGTRQTQAYFDMAPLATHPGEQVSGVVRFPEQQANEPLADTTIGLRGPLTGDICAVQLKADEDEHVGVWTLRIDSDMRMTGTRRLSDSLTEPVMLSIVPETRCDAVIEWRTFRSRRWPITFEYPADWRLNEDADDITIECPSIADLANRSSSLIFERGRFRPASFGRGSADHNSFADPYWFFRLEGNDWRIGPVGCATDAAHGQGCPPARRSDHNGLTVLQGAAGEHRLYRPGVGYLGQGGGITRFLFIAGDEWVSLDAAAQTSHHDHLGNAGGPVLFDGGEIADRVVRSVSAR
jgi:hypothetical protein